MGGTAEKKSETLKNMGPSGGGQGGQRDEQNGTGVQGARPRSIGARTGQNGPKLRIPLVCAGQPAWGGQNKLNFWK